MIQLTRRRLFAGLFGSALITLNLPRLEASNVPKAYSNFPDCSYGLGLVGDFKVIGLTTNQLHLERSKDKVRRSFCRGTSDVKIGDLITVGIVYPKHDTYISAYISEWWSL